jgi:hypothetical protein
MPGDTSNVRLPLDEDEELELFELDERLLLLELERELTLDELPLETEDELLLDKEEELALDTELALTLDPEDEFDGSDELDGMDEVESDDPDEGSLQWEELDDESIKQSLTQIFRTANFVRPLKMPIIALIVTHTQTTVVLAP